MIAAANAGDLAAVTRLADEDAANLGPLTDTGVTALFLAAKNGHAHLIPLLGERMMLEHINRGPNNHPPLLVAITHGHTACIDALLDHPHTRWCAGGLRAARTSQQLDAVVVPILRHARGVNLTAADFGVLLRDRTRDWLSVIAPYGSLRRGRALAQAATDHQPAALLLAARWGAKLSELNWRVLLKRDQVAAVQELVALGQRPLRESVTHLRSPEMLRAMPHDRALLVERLPDSDRTLTESLAGSARTAALVCPLLLRLSKAERRATLDLSWRGHVGGWRPRPRERSTVARAVVPDACTAIHPEALDTLLALERAPPDPDGDIVSDLLRGERAGAAALVRVLTSHPRMRPLVASDVLAPLQARRTRPSKNFALALEAALRARRVGHISGADRELLVRRLHAAGLARLEPLARTLGGWVRRGPLVLARRAGRSGAGRPMLDFVVRRCPERAFRVVVRFL